ncbi:hypothetical protein ACQUSR_19220 [Streptomyces sp. P1-3]|uniref:hypothetical protein n=1 Tax=Streptomyces sp. P1-3 TaxID=3421658 RepID=UPI003D35DC49
MLKRKEERNAVRLLGNPPAIGDWCTIGRIPRPPKDVHAAAGSGRLRPGLMPPDQLLVYALASPFLLAAAAVGFVFEILPEIVLRYLFYSKKSREEDRRNWSEGRRRHADIEEHRLNDVFDGNWHASAGQLLLRWYSQSRHHTRLVLLAPGRIVLAAPLKRAWRNPDDSMQIVAEIPGGQAIIEDPLRGKWQTGRFRIRFRDGSWLVIRAKRSDPEIAMILGKSNLSERDLPVRF